jgi:peptidoglycan/xylan/chitin deacetylase (PgdA/CDA1 family)
LDFELLWGVRDHADQISYGKNVLGARKAIPQILELFAKNGIRATWATVGFLFCKTRDELFEMAPPEDRRPHYANPALSNYSYFSEVGRNEAEDPYYFAASLIDRISKTPGQEIATHTFSHFYTLEAGATTDAFAADLEAASMVATEHGITLKSIVFPRNQYNKDCIDICRTAGLSAWRGNPSSWAYKASDGEGQTLLRRGLRLIDAHTGILGAQTYASEISSFRNVPASQFLRPRSGQLAPVHPAHIATVMRAMTSAAKTGRGYHLWWHPHNFGVNTMENMSALTEIIIHFQRLQAEYGMVSSNMGAQI